MKGSVRPIHRRRIKLPRQHKQAFEQIVVGDDEFAPVRRIVRPCVGALVEWTCRRYLKLDVSL